MCKCPDYMSTGVLVESKGIGKRRFGKVGSRYEVSLEEKWRKSTDRG